MRLIFAGAQEDVLDMWILIYYFLECKVNLFLVQRLSLLEGESNFFS